MTKSRLEKFIESFAWVRAESFLFSKPLKPLSESKVALITTGGVYELTDKPFNIVGRDDVDESFREISLVTPYENLSIAHEHFNKEFANEDLNVVFPVNVLKGLANEGFIKEVSETNFSITGFVPKPNALFDTGEQIAKRLVELNVDIALIVPV